MRAWLLPGLGLGLIGIVTAQYRLLEPGPEGIRNFVALGAVGAALYLVAAWIVLRPALRHPLAPILATAALMRVVPLAAPAVLSTDLYRYVWDGRVQLSGINPYRYVPAAPELAPLRDADFPMINRAEYAPTIYPPAAQAIFAAIAAIRPSPAGVKAAMLGCEALAVLVMLRLLTLAGLPRERVLIYAWQPLWPWEYAGNGHIDAAGIAFVGLALLAAARRRDGWAGAALAAAFMVKLLPVAIAPALWRGRGWRMPAAAAAVALAGYAAYASAGLRIFGFLGGYAQEEGVTNGGGVLAIQLARLAFDLPPWAGAAWLLAAAVALGALAWPMLRAPEPADPALRLRRMATGALVLATTMTAALTPHYAWYFGWLAYLACLAPLRCAIWLTAACVLLYTLADHTALGWSSPIYAPFLLLAARDARRPL